MSLDVFGTAKQIQITPWVAFTPTWKANTSDPTPSGSATTAGFWRRVGSNMDIVAFITNGGVAGTAGSGTYYLLIPDSKTADEARINPSASTLTQIDGGATVSYTGNTYLVGTPVFRQSVPTGIFLEVFSSTVANAYWSSSNASFGDAAMKASFKTSVPIVGWT
jgi:hypothetical protein